MTYAQERIVTLAPALSDFDANMILTLMERLVRPLKEKELHFQSEKERAYQELSKMVGGFPADFDPDKELAVAREEKYGTID